MRWRQKPEPQYGDIRITTKFPIFFPLTINGMTYWLEKITVKQVLAWSDYSLVWHNLEVINEVDKEEATKTAGTKSNN